MHSIDCDETHPTATKREPVSLAGGVDWRNSMHHLGLEVHRVTHIGNSVYIDPRSVGLFHEQTALSVVLTTFRHHDRGHDELVVSNGI
jgi:hypothetical protein